MSCRYREWRIVVGGGHRRLLALTQGAQIGLAYKSDLGAR